MAKKRAFVLLIIEWINFHSFNGCTFINASAEFVRQQDPIHVSCENNKKLVIQYIEELLTGLSLKDSCRVAKQISLLIEGAIVMAHTAGDNTAAILAKDTAGQLLEGYLDATRLSR